MRGYGLPRRLEVEWPDMADARLYGLATRRAGAGWKKAAAKAAARRLWKRAARRAARREIAAAVEAIADDVQIEGGMTMKVSETTYEGSYYDLLQFGKAWAELGWSVQAQVEDLVAGDTDEVNPAAIKAADRALRGYNEELDMLFDEYRAEQGAPPA